MEKYEFFNKYTYGLEDSVRIEMPKELERLYEKFEVKMPQKECAVFPPLRRGFDGLWSGYYDSASQRMFAFQKIKVWRDKIKRIVTYDGQNAYAAEIDEAGCFQKYPELIGGGSKAGKSAGSLLSIAAYEWIKHTNPPEYKELEKVLFDEPFITGVELCIKSDFLYRMYGKIYSFQNIKNKQIPLLTREMLFEQLEGCPEEKIKDLIESLEVPKRIKVKDSSKKATTSTKSTAKSKGKDDKTKALVKALQDKYRKAFKVPRLTAEEKTKVPKWKDEWVVTDTLIRALDSATFVGNNLLLYGPSGTGKSTIAMQVACILGLPYRFYVCSEKTDESSLLLSIIPKQTNAEEKSRYQAALAQLELIKLDAPSWMEIVTGVYNKDVTEQECYSFIKNYDHSNSAFEFVESELVKGIRQPSVVEIQEPTAIAKPAVLVALNSLLDDNEKIKVATGEMISRHEKSIIILTTNISYNGCRAMNQSVLSRMDGVIALSNIRKSELVERAMKKVNLKKADEYKVEKMAGYFLEIVKYLKENAICDDAGGDGIIDPRGFVSWVKAYMNSDLSLRESCRLTLIARTSLQDLEEQERTWDCCVKQILPEEL